MPSDVPLLAFVGERLPEGPPAWKVTARLLQVLAWLFLAAPLLFVLQYGWMMTQGASSGAMEGPWLATFVAAGLFALLSVVGFALVFAWWASYAYGHWCRRRRTGYYHALGLAALVGLQNIPQFWDLADLRSLPAFAYVAWSVLGVFALLGVAVFAGCCLPSVWREFMVPTPPPRPEATQ